MTESYRHMIGAGLVVGLFCMGCGASRHPAPSGVSSIASGRAASPGAKPDSRPPRHSKADAEFMQGMIGHHAQALTMAHMVPTHTDNPRIHLLAQRIDVSQKDEIKQMQRWLEDRHEMVPSVDAEHAHHEGMDHGGGALMPGMLTAEQLGQLDAARGAVFDTLFLRFMISHHEGALVMVAKLFGTNGAGQDAQLFGYASDVDADQRAEIARMRTMLGAPPNEAPRR